MSAREVIAKAIHEDWRSGHDSPGPKWDDDRNTQAAFLHEADVVIAAVRGMSIEDIADLHDEPPVIFGPYR